MGPNSDVGGRRIGGGLLDVGFASMATFLVGAYAVRYLDPATLGGYGLYFSGFLLAALFPSQLLFVPAEVTILPSDEDRQLATIPLSIRLSLPIALPASIIVCALVPLVARDTPAADLLAIGITTAVASVLSPAQDHIRRVLHQCHRSGKASQTSMVQLAAIVLALGVCTAAGVPSAWVPFGSLAFANFASISFALSISHRGARTTSPLPLALAELTRRGRWLLYSAVVERGSGLIALAAVSIVAGTAAAGYVEATRVLSQPVLIFGMGLMAVMRPAIMRAAGSHDRERSRTLTLQYFAAIGLGAAALALAIGIDWSFSPLSTFFAPAYAEPGLLALAIAGAAVGASTLIVRNEVIGAALESRLGPLSSTAAVAMVVVAIVLVGPIGAYAMPMAIMARGMILDLLQWRLLRPHYAVGSVEPSQAR